MPTAPPPAPRKRTVSERITRLGLVRHPLGDLYHLLLTASWARLFVMIIVFFLSANALFALLYHLDAGGIENARSDSYLDSFFFSVQTMATIGYGRLVPRSVFANTVVTIEALFGMLSLALSTGLMFAKFSRPSARVLFSRYAVVARRDGAQSLSVRLANERSTGMVEAQLRLILLRDEVTAEGERMRRFHTLPLVRSQSAMFALSWTAIHTIDEASPLFGVGHAELEACSAEIVASVVGYDDATMATVHARHTWVVSEILFGKRFVDIVSARPSGDRAIDYTKFHDVEDAAD